MTRFSPLALMFAFVCLGLSHADERPCKVRLTQMELFARLQNDPYFANGVPPPGKKMRIDTELCGFRIYVGESSPDALNGDIVIVNDEGKIQEIIHKY